MSQVFISYSRADQEWVEEATAAIEQAGFDTWIDTRKIPASVVWMDEIRDAIEASSLVIAFESQSFSDSVHCGTEIAIASELDRHVTSIPVGTARHEVVETVRSAMTERPPELERSIELTVRAREWDRRGRGRRGLVSGRTLRALRRSREALHRDIPNVDAFLRASRRRMWIRRGIIAVGVWFAIVILNVDSSLDVVSAETDEANAELMETLAGASNARQALANDVYAGLESLVPLGSTEAAISANLLAEGIATPVPDDAFSLPHPAAGFVDNLVTDVVVVEAADGSIWERSSKNHDVREAMPSVAGGHSEEIDGVGTYEVRTTDDSAIVTLEKDARIHRRLVASGPVSVAKVSPDLHEVAVASGDILEILDIDTGMSKMTYLGAPGPISDIAWSADGSRIWATSGLEVVSWQRRRGAIVLERPESWFVSVLPSDADSVVWVADLRGELLKIDVDRGTVLESMEFDGEIQGAGGSDDGRTAAIVGERSVFLVDLATGVLREVAGDCFATDPVFAQTGPEVYVSCGSEILVIDRTDGRTTRKIDLKDSVAYSLAIDPTDDRLVVADQSGRLLKVGDDIDSLGTSPWFGCGTPQRSIDISPTGDIVGGGIGTGQFGCTVILHRQGTGYEEQWLSHAAAQSNRARSVLVLEDGERYATGYGDGRIIITPIEDVLPQSEISEVVGDVRDMIQIGNDLVVVTRAGILHRYPVDPVPLTNKRLAGEIQERLDRAHLLGLFP